MKNVFLNFKKTTYDTINLATLGPKGTSSERSAVHFGHLLVSSKITSDFKIHLCDTYEHANRLLLNQTCEALVVANAYHGISEFYMDSSLNLSAAFLKNTPNYGIATNVGNPKRVLRIATHPAPTVLINELLPSGYSIENIEFKSSTSSAAISVVNGEVDAALTTEVAAKLHNLRFISNIRPIQMLWSVFTMSDNSSIKSYQSE
ncbi:bacilysin biosynthesis protein BacA [Endozoicomonas sp. SM1973]|uniref:Bacilysin biosynthesis protein BacA n=1 Tax=Spartinivicinus marinus TaxID=2994442 RepID=A0A853IM88_9GAMM|nr:bacilysin biosynthesis protein BacA [Spartinivicinus marinus]MCX4027519.1 bacilysin biosynthesis protein BacA [Spartinivicinus marinus]NYZ68896.1 bacilysin biosynthesis protein BacA [Spartinivicinus marinus]